MAFRISDCIRGFRACQGRDRVDCDGRSDRTMPVLDGTVASYANVSNLSSARHSATTESSSSSAPAAWASFTGRRTPARPDGGAQGPAARLGRRRGSDRAVPARSADGVEPEPPEHLHDLRLRRARRAAATWRWSCSKARRSMARLVQRAARSAHAARRRRRRSPTRSTPRTPKASCTATSSRRTSS